MPSDRQAGFTLVELMITLAVLAVLLAIGLPNFQQSLRNNRVATTTNDMIAAISLARSEAIRNTRGGAICASEDGLTCGDDWSLGWIVWRDGNANGTPQANEIVRFTQGNPRMVVTGPDAPVVFDARGRVNAPVDITVRPHECGSSPMLRTLSIGVTGQVRKQAPGVCS
ncbi:GspH/FimT family pseudopilin [Pseudoxanthomonas suwonensis]|uniref:Type II secretion system protein H n=1 Tax=Pseudoxanthomonas suwonensis TaxID=314722 RepID=A0A0E3UP33_9GAMM|nr:GspH/FimT family pseudopilin [Pseudoxanthomonas suwonensis]AKC87475.1 hypothetical protein WQ53_12630 [Pseudoxanthomonas suwonensis]